MYNKKMMPVVVLSAHTMGLGVIRALGLKGIPIISVYYNDCDMGYVSKYVKYAVNSCHPEHEEEKFLQTLLNLYKNFGKCILFPADDPSLVTVSKNKYFLDDYFIIAAPEWKVTQKFISKNYTYSLAEKLGIDCPRTLTPKTEEEACYFSEIINYPCLIKPYESHLYFEQFRRKMTVVNDKNELLNEMEIAMNFKIKVLVQEIIPGKETNGFNYNSYIWDKSILTDFYAQKVRYTNEGFGVPIVVKSCGPKYVLKTMTEKLLNEMNFHGFSCTEYKLDPRDNKLKLMEVNGRHNRSGLLAIKSGINFPWLEYNHLVNGIIPKQLKYKNNIYWIDEFRDLVNVKSRIQKFYSVIEFFKPYIKSHIMAISTFRDLKPLIKRFGDSFTIISKAFNYKRNNKNLRSMSHNKLVLTKNAGSSNAK